MRRSKLSALARSITLLVSVGAPCFAQAADLLPPLPPEPLPPPIEIGGGWYLRGDVGVGATQFNKIVTTQEGGALPAGYRVDETSISDSYFAGAGVGYQFNAFLRGDITAEYRGGNHLRFTDSADTYRNFNGVSVPTFDKNGAEVFENTGKPWKSIDSYNANLASVVVMANGYIDLGTWYGVTPYVGGGVGSAFHRVSGFSDFGAGGAQGGYGFAPEKHFTNFAWNAQAGLAYSVTPNLKLEVGYRYMNLGDSKLGTIKCFNSGCNVPFSYVAKDITSHDVKIGMRWLLGGVAVAPLPPVYEPEPIVRKY